MAVTPRPQLLLHFIISGPLFRTDSRPTTRASSRRPLPSDDWRSTFCRDTIRLSSKSSLISTRQEKCPPRIHDYFLGEHAPAPSPSSWALWCSHIMTEKVRLRPNYLTDVDPSMQGGGPQACIVLKVRRIYCMDQISALSHAVLNSLISSTCA